jgi:DNA repair protein RecO
MAYATYTTDAIVCGTFVRNTADATYALFTRDAGMLFADAKSVREERSRQRYALQDFSLVRVSLVRGKTGWKIGSVESKQNFYAHASDRRARGMVTSIIKHIRRFVRGETPHPELFELVLQCLTKAATTLQHPTRFEYIFQVHVLFQLGYVPVLPDTIARIPVDIWDEISDSSLDATLATIIHTAVTASQM